MLKKFFKKTKKKKKPHGNPYIDNRLQYSSVLEAVEKNTRGWRLLTFFCSIVSIFAVCGVVYIGSQSKIVPIVIEIDGYGIPARFYPVTEETALGDARITAAAISTVISAIREVSTDPDVMIHRLENAAYFFQQGSPAFNKVQEFINSKNMNPFSMG